MPTTYPRFDRTLRVVMWLDAFWSVAAVAAALVGLPLVAVLPVAPTASLVVGVVAIVAAVLLAAFGTVTGVVLLMRMNEGNYTLPADLRLPLPRGMRPPIGAADR